MALKATLIREFDDPPTDDNPTPSPWHVEEYVIRDEHGSAVCTIQRTPLDFLVFPMADTEWTVKQP